MRAFTYKRATTAAEAVAAARDGAIMIAGGTNLLDLMKLEVVAPSQLVDISRLDLGGIERTAAGGLHIGALVTNSDLAAHEIVRRDYPVLARALLAGASGQLRNMATTGGNLLQRTRCYYFYDRAMACNKRTPGAGCSAIEGYNRIHAIIGASEHCIATHPSDMAVALLALDANVEIEGVNRDRRSVPLDDFYCLPDDNPERENVLQAGELITGITLPAPIPTQQRYRKVRDRASYAFALVSVAAIVAIENGKISHARLAFGGIAPRPWRDDNVDGVLQGASPRQETFEAAADELLESAVGRGDNDFKIPLLRRTLIATLQDATR